MSDLPADTLTTTIAEALAGHRQQHRPATGDSECACGDWIGPFTITTGDRSYAHHLAAAVVSVLATHNEQTAADAWDEGYKAAYLFERGETYPEPTNPYAPAPVPPTHTTTTEDHDA